MINPPVLIFFAHIGGKKGMAATDVSLQKKLFDGKKTLPDPISPFAKQATPGKLSESTS